MLIIRIFGEAGLVRALQEHPKYQNSIGAYPFFKSRKVLERNPQKLLFQTHFRTREGEYASEPHLEVQQSHLFETIKRNTTKGLCMPCGNPFIHSMQEFIGTILNSEMYRTHLDARAWLSFRKGAVATISARRTHAPRPSPNLSTTVRKIINTVESSLHSSRCSLAQSNRQRFPFLNCNESGYDLN